MAIANDRGFVPVRHQIGGINFSTGPLRPTDGANAAQIFAGDVVRIDTSGRVQRYTDAASAASNPLPLGVVADVLNANRRPFTFNQPDSGPFIPVSTTGFVRVYEDPGIIYAANCSSTATFQDVGSFVQVRVCAPTTAAGRSGMGVDLPGVATAAGHAFKLVGLSSLDGILDEAATSGDVNNDVEVIMVNGLFNNPHRSFEVGAPASATG